MRDEQHDPDRVDLYGTQYSNFRSDVLSDVRREAFVDDFGQNGWQTAAEQDCFIAQLGLTPQSHLLDVACGSGGPSLRIAGRTGCALVGIDRHEAGIALAQATAAERGLHTRARFLATDAAARLPFDGGTFDGVICIDAINHLPHRARVLSEFARVLKPEGRLLYSDPIVLTGWLSSEEMRIRSSIGLFHFFALGVNEQLLEEARFEVLSVEDGTENMASMATRWRAARERRAGDLCELEGPAAFEGQQLFFEVTARLASERRLSRRVYLARKL